MTITDDLDAYVEPEFDCDVEPPTLTTIGEADRHLRAISRLERRLASYEQVARDDMQRVKDWLHERSDVLLRQIEWHASSVEQWMRAHHDETGTKTEKLPHGELRVRPGKVRVEPFGDPDPRFSRTRVDWDKRAVSDACEPGPELEEFDTPHGFVAHVPVTGDGEVVPGAVLLVPTSPSFSYKAGG